MSVGYLGEWLESVGAKAGVSSIVQGDDTTDASHSSTISLRSEADELPGVERA